MSPRLGRIPLVAGSALACVVACLLATACTGEPSGTRPPAPGLSSAVTTGSTSGSPTVGTSEPPDPMPRRPAEVVYVSDGDTIAIRFRGQDQVRRIRLLGIDTPETKDPDTGVECGGPAASLALTRMLPRGSEVHLLTDPDEDRFDRYGRLLRYVDTTAQGDVALVLLRRGLARYYVYNRVGVRYPRYRDAEARARAAGRGSWSACPDFGA
jgi:micrococcal nuclease